MNKNESDNYKEKTLLLLFRGDLVHTGEGPSPVAAESQGAHQAGWIRRINILFVNLYYN